MKRLAFILTTLIVARAAHTEPTLPQDIYIEAEYKVAATRYDLDPKLFKALLMVESNLNHTAVNVETLDFGIGQINYKTAEAYNIDIQRLRTDRAYSIDRAAFIFSTFKKYNKSKAPDNKRWVCFYNVGPSEPKGARLIACEKYLKKIRLAYSALGFVSN